MIVETERLRLRPWREEDKSTLCAIINTPAMMVHFGGVVPDAEIDALVDRMMASQARDGFSMGAVELRSDGSLAGICGLRRDPAYAAVPVGGMLEIGWRIAQPLWRQGIAREAAQASLDWAWANTDAPLVAAWTSEGNGPSWRLMQRLGMVRRPDLDFHHPKLAHDNPLGAMIVYTIDRPA